MDSSLPHFPSVLDNTMVSAYRACGKKLWWRHVEMLQKGEQSIHLISGGAFAKGLEVTRKSYFDKNLSFEDSLAFGAAALFNAYGNVDPSPKYSAKEARNMVGALAYYFETWPIDKIITPKVIGARHAIEWNFAVPIPNAFHPDTKAPILYCGRFDMVGEHENKMLVGEDDKTTSQLGESWFNRWKLSNQILGYCWGAREHGLNLGAFNVRGISLLKNSYGHAEALVMVNDWMIDRFVSNLQHTVKRMIHSYQSNTWEMDMGSSCSAYGGCDFLVLCQSHQPEVWKEINFTKNEWNPLASRD